MQTKSGSIKLKTVSYVPSMTKNLISVGAIADCRYKVIFSDLQCWVIDKQGNTIASGHRDSSNGLYCFQNTTYSYIATQHDTAELWHRRMGHLNYPGLHHLSTSNFIEGMPCIDPQKQICQCCLARRQHRERFPR